MKNKFGMVLISFVFLCWTGFLRATDVVLQNNVGIKCVLPEKPEGFAFGSIYVNDNIIEKPLLKGIIKFLDAKDNKDNNEYWFYASKYKKLNDSKASFSGKGKVNGIDIIFTVMFETPSNLQAVRIVYDFSVSRDIEDLQAVLQYNSEFIFNWKCHMYPLVEDSKYIQCDPLAWMGIPSLFMYRDDRSLGLLWGIDPNSDYLNPTTWTRDFGLYFIDGIMPAQFRVGGLSLKKEINYHCPMQIVLTDKSDPDEMIIDLMKNWIALNKFKVEPLHVRSNDEALQLFIKGRKNTSMWYPGQGYRLEMGDPSSAFIYIGEQGLSAYFDYLIYELTDDAQWRKRAFEQMDFILKGQNSDPHDPNYGVVHTAYSLVDYGPAGKGFNSVDRGNNKGYKVDLNIYLGRYMLMLWKIVNDHEGIDRQDWYKSAILAIDWAVRQQNNDGGFPQKVEFQPIEVRWRGEEWMGTRQLSHVKYKFGEKSRSTTSGRALPALWHIYKMTKDQKYKRCLDKLEKYNLKYVHNMYYYTSHHPDLPPFELEEASIWGVCEHWLNRFEETKNKAFLNHAVSEAYLALTWKCPKQLSWVNNPTQLASAEQQHYLQYSIYCYQNRKVECLKRLYNITGNVLFDQLSERVTQNVYWTQIAEGDLMGATHERIADPWLARADSHKLDFNSMGTIYMSEQSLDLLLQIVEMYRMGKALYYGDNLVNKIYPDGKCYYSEDISEKMKVGLSVLPSKCSIKVFVNNWDEDYKKWTVKGAEDLIITTTHKVSELKPNTWYYFYVNGKSVVAYQSNSKGKIVFAYTGNLKDSTIFEVKSAN